MTPPTDDVQHLPTRLLDEDGGEPLEQGQTIRTEEDAPTETDGNRLMEGRAIGSIRLEEILGQGGMGTVYRGVDETLGRTVAVKSIRAGHSLGGQARARFLREAQVLSRLNHPNICQVFDFVEGEDEDYLVMELVAGRSLGGEIQDGISRQNGLRIALQLAEVLTLTHARGIVHRDLKPENVMLTEDGVVKVLDFGLAREDRDKAPVGGPAHPIGAIPPVVESSVETVLGTVVGTLGYMSPEQARGEAASPPSDIYSLGLVLQELFTGQRPFKSDSTMQQLLLATAMGTSPAIKGLPSDLTGLLKDMKAIDTDDRPTAADVAHRLRRIIDTPKRRIRWAVGIIALLIAVSGATKYVVDLGRERNAALAARTEALAAREDAEELMGFILEDLFVGLKPLGRLDLLDQVANQALDYYRPENLEGTLTDKALLRRGLALRNLGGVFEDQGALDQAEDAYRSSLEIAQELETDNPTDQGAILGVARAHIGLASVQLMRDDPTGALSSHEEAATHLEHLVDLDPSQSEWRRRLADTIADQGHLLFTIGQVETARNTLQRSVAMTEELVIEIPDDTELRLDLGTKYRLLSQVLASQGMVADARNASDDDIAVCTTVARSDETNTNARLGLVEGYTWRGRLLMDQGDLDAAQEAMRSAVRVGERLVADDPSNTHRQFRLSASYDYLGEALRADGKVTAALEAFNTALELMQPIAAIDASNAYYQNDLAYSHLQVGKALAELGRRNEARDAWAEAARVVAPVADENGLPPIQETFAQALLLLGRVDEARPVVRRVLESGWPLDPTTAELCRRHGIETDG